MAWRHVMTSPLRALMSRLLGRWTAPRLIEPAPDALELEPSLPVLYVLPGQAMSDAWLLDALARRHGLPRAGGHRRVGELSLDACLALPSPRREPWRRRARPTAPFQALIEQRLANPSQEVQLVPVSVFRSEEHTSELQSRPHLVCRLLLEKKKKNKN